jgi:spore germination protein GerM
VPTATARPAGATSAQPTRRPIGQRAPTRAPANPPLPPAPANPPPTQAPAGAVRNQSLTLYFADPSGTLYVPVQRTVRVVNNQVARAAIGALIDGPRGGLRRLVLPDVQVLDVRIEGRTAVVNFDRWPTGAGDERGFYAMTLTLTHFSGVHQVQFQVNGRNVGVGDDDGPIVRPTLNPLNPDGLPFDTSTTEFLPLYFPLIGARQDVRLIRMVPKTIQTAEGTVRALLEGPGEYGDRVYAPIPGGTELRGIKKANSGVILVDFTQPFADAPDRQAAVRTLVASLTSLPGVNGVQILVEGTSLADQWGQNYGRVFRRMAINAE